MAFSIPNPIEFRSEITSAEHEQNYLAIQTDLNTEVIRRDGSVAMLAELQLVGSPTTPQGAASKLFVETADAAVTAAAAADATTKADAATAVANTAQAAAEGAQATADALNNVVPCTVNRVYDATANQGVLTITLPTTVGGKTMTGAVGVMGSVTVISTGIGGYLTIYPFSVGATPQGSQCNYGDVVSDINNGFFAVTVDSSRRFKMYRHANCRVIVDIQAVIYG